MITIQNETQRLYQWDLGQRLIIEGYPAGTEVHCALADAGRLLTPPHGERRSALVVVSYDENGKVYADIPNILLQKAGELNVYIYPEEGKRAHTAERRCFTVIARERPADYVYTETEVKRWEELADKVDEAVDTASDAANAANDAASAANKAADAANSAADSANDAAEKAARFAKGQLSYINVSAELGFGSASAPINLSALEITDHTVLYFSKGTFYLRPLTLSGIEHLTVLAHEAQIFLTGTRFIYASNCHYFSVYGGEINGNNSAIDGIDIQNSKHCTIKDITFRDFGNSRTDGARMLSIFGDCSGFAVENCTFDTCTSGIVGEDGFIHAWGIFVNRLASDNSFPKTGVIRGCTIQNIAGIDNGTQKADGDGIFIQAPPYLRDDGSVEWRSDHCILIENCVFADCKKRAIKNAAACVTVRDCTISGEMWYAAIDARFGHMTIENSCISNTTTYTDSLGAGIVSNDGGLTVRDCTLHSGCTADTNINMGIRINARFEETVVPSSVPYDDIYVENCFFDGVSYAVHVYGDGTNKISAKGIFIKDCRVGKFHKAQPFFISDTLLSAIETLVITDWALDHGTNRTDVKAVYSTFSYPIMFSVDPAICCEIHSSHWTSEPRSGDLPTSPNGYIEYTGNIGGITHKKYTAYRSELVGTRDPESVTATLGKQLLYHSKIGDTYINSSNGNLWICTAAGTADTIGVWTALTGASVAYENGNEVDY